MHLTQQGTVKCQRLPDFILEVFCLICTQHFRLKEDKCLLQIFSTSAEFKRHIHETREFIYDDIICSGLSEENPKVKSILSLRNLLLLSASSCKVLSASQRALNDLLSSCSERDAQYPVALTLFLLSFCSLGVVFCFVLLALLPGYNTLPDTLIRAKGRCYFSQIVFL